MPQEDNIFSTLKVIKRPIFNIICLEHLKRADLYHPQKFGNIQINRNTFYKIKSAHISP